MASTSPINHSADSEPEIPVNSLAQKKVANEITIAEKKLIEFEQIYNFTTDYQLRYDTYIRIEDL